MSGITFSEATGLNDSIFGKSQAPVRLFLETKSEEYEKLSALKKLFLTEKSSHYAEKLTAIIKNNDIKSVTIVRMEVPCCGGIENAVKRALQASGKFIPWQVITVSTDGKILE